MESSCGYISATKAVSPVWVKYFIDSPAYQRRFAVTGIVLGGVSVDTVDNHAVRLLVVEHGSDVVLGQFGVEFSGSGTEAPAIPCPKPTK